MILEVTSYVSAVVKKAAVLSKLSSRHGQVERRPPLALSTASKESPDAAPRCPHLAMYRGNCNVTLAVTLFYHRHIDQSIHIIVIVTPERARWQTQQLYVKYDHDCSNVFIVQT